MSYGPPDRKLRYVIDRLQRLLQLQVAIREAALAALRGPDAASLALAVREQDGASDTIFGIDDIAERVLLPACEEWGRHEPFLLVAEGIEPSGSRRFGHSMGDPAFRLILDPVDGSRGLMFDKRSAWCLGAIAVERGAATSLRDVVTCAMTELPTSRQDRSDRIWLDDDRRLHAVRDDLRTGAQQSITLRPSPATDLRQAFATVCNFFPGGREIISRVDEKIMQRAVGDWNPETATVYSDQYISSGGQFAELMLGRERFILDIRPLVHRRLGVTSSLCSRPYDICTAGLAQAAGCIIQSPDGAQLNPPLDVSTNVAFVAYANAQLANDLGPVVRSVLAEEGLI